MNLAQHIIIGCVRLYQRAVSPALAALVGPLGHCRFTPTCSHYAVEAIRTHGAVKGAGLAAWRICRCNPWGGCGEDPVPKRAAWCVVREEEKDTNCTPLNTQHATHNTVPHFSHGS